MKTHSAAKCQAKDPSTCPYHGSSSKAAVNRNDVNAFIDAKLAETKLTDSDIQNFLNTKPTYPTGYKSLDTLDFNGTVLDIDGLFEKTGVSHFELNEIMYRSKAGTIHHPTEEMKSLRFKTALFNKELDNTISEMADKKFGRFTTKKAKDEYYASKVEEVQKIAKNVKQYAEESMRAENLNPNNLSPVQRGEHYEVEAGGVFLYDEGYIPEHLHKEEAEARAKNVVAAYEEYKKTGEFKIFKRAGVNVRG